MSSFHDGDLPSSGAPPAPLSAVSALRHRSVRSLLWPTLLLYLAISLQFTALAKQVYDINDRELDLAFLGLAEFVPALALVLVTGSVVDRFNRRTVALLAIGVELLATIALLLYTLTEPTRTGPFFAIALLYGIGRAFQAPATRTMPPMVAPEGGLSATVALFSASFTLALILGSVAGGVAYAVDPVLPYIASGLLLLGSLVGMARVQFLRQPDPPDPNERPSLRSATEGLRFVRRTPILLGAISLDLFAVLFGGSVALLPAIAEDRLGVGDVGYGFLRAAIGIGAGLMALFLAFVPLRRNIGRWLFIVVAIFGAGSIVLGVTRNYAVAFIALVIISAADMVSVVIRSTLVPLVTPDEMRGRVLSVENVFIGASNELGAAESGFAAHLVGTPATVIGGGIGTLVVVVAWWLMFPALRGVDRFDDIDHQRQPTPAT